MQRLPTYSSMTVTVAKLTKKNYSRCFLTDAFSHQILQNTAREPLCYSGSSPSSLLNVEEKGFHRLKARKRRRHKASGAAGTTDGN